MNKKLYMQKRAVRPVQPREAQVDLSKLRVWFANNTVSYGFVNLENLASQRLTDVPLQTIQTAIRESVEEHTRELNGILSSLVTVVPDGDYKMRFQLPAGGTLQPLDANGNPKPVQPTGTYDIAFPIQGGGTAWGNNRVSRAKMTVADADRFTWDAMDKDADWMRRHILAAIFTNTTWTYTDEEHGDLTVQPLANGDTVTYVRVGGSSSTDTHYLAQANAIGNGADNPFPTIYAELDEHPSNSGPYVVYVASNLVSSIEALSNFIEPSNPALIYGANTTRMEQVVDVDMTSRISQGFGDRLVGYVDGCVIIEWRALPDSYMIAHASGVNDVVGMREYDAPELKGFFPEFNDVNGNHYEYRMIRYAGFGIMNRVGALVMRIGNGTYAIPSGYTAPLPA